MRFEKPPTEVSAVPPKSGPEETTTASPSPCGRAPTPSEPSGEDALSSQGRAQWQEIHSLKPKFLHLLRQRIKPSSLAEDVWQEISISLYKHLRNGRSIREVEGYTYRTAQNAIKAHYRKAATAMVEVYVGSDDYLYDVESPTSDEENLELGKIVQVIKERRILTDYELRVYLHRECFGFKPSEIAKILGTTSHAISQAMHSANSKFETARDTTDLAEALGYTTTPSRRT